MADKKDAKEEAGPLDHSKFYSYLGEITALLFAVFFLARLFTRFRGAIESRGYISDSPQVNAILSSIFYFIASFILFFTIFSNILSVLFLMGIIYSVIRLTEMSNETEAELKSYEEGTAEEGAPEEGNKEWARIEALLDSDNESDWKLAIIEADILLGEMLEKMGLPGETIADRLKAVEKSDFTTIEYAWEAHKIRNSIAHEGKNFLINKREVDRVISLYEAVFKEFKLI